MNIVEGLQNAMKFSPSCNLQRPLDGDLAAVALQKPAEGESLPTDLIRRIVKFEARHLSGGSPLHI